jgi:pimeloyl-ACP methyl ester carboxylesterase
MSTFWRTGLIMAAVVLGALSILPYLMSDGAGRAMPSQPYGDSRFAEVDGMRLHYRLAEPEGPARGQVFLVHGLAGSTVTWDTMMPALASAGWRVVAADLPPFGFSERAVPGRDGKTAAALMWELLDGVDDGHSPWVLAGHSMGATQVSAMTRIRPGAVAGLILVGGVPDTWRSRDGPVSYHLNRAILAYPPARRWLSVIGGSRFLHEDGMRRVLSSAYGSEPDEQAVRAHLQPLQIQGTPDAVIRFISAARREAPRLADDGPRVRVLWGGRDEWVPLSRAQRFVDSHPGAELTVIEEAGHMPMATHPEETLQAVLGFLEALSG